MNPGHQPERFKVFNYLPNQRAFTIKGSTHVFHIDRYGGWFDEHGNYYNQNAQPEEPPSSSQSYSNDRDEHSKGSSDSDEFQKQFERPGYVQDVPEEEAIMVSMAKNLSQLQNYSKNSLVRVFFSNLGHHSRRQEIIKAYSQNVGNILNIVIDKKSDKRKETGYFIVEDLKTAQNLIHLEGVKVIQRPLYFEVEPFYDCLLNPIQEGELKDKEKPRYVPKHKETSMNQGQSESNKEISNPWVDYKFEKDIFPKKSSFKEWMHEHCLIFSKDFNNVEKIENEPKYAKVGMKLSTFKSINGLTYNGQKVQFFPI